MSVGIVGAGQLGRMLAMAGYPLGLEFLFLDPAKDPPAAALAPHLVGSFDDRSLLGELARRCKIITFDWENVSVGALRELAGRARICPPLAALAASQDRVSEKRLFERLKIPTTRWRAVGTLAQLRRAVRDIGLPGVLKTRRLGYDGKGQTMLQKDADLAPAWRQLGAQPLLYEERIGFSEEVSIIGARSTHGEIAIYPLNGNVHAQGILRLTRAPYGPPAWQQSAKRYLCRVLAHFRYVGILAIEFFVRRGRLIANEMAPRVHNSGHWTIEGAVTSQFENHLRAILGLPLGETRARGHCAMVNLIGRMPPLRELLAHEGLHVHDYGKAPRPGRKLGHCTLVARSRRERDRRLAALLATLAPNTRIP
jgi:5-(carboxyamino)imidazole ribonucleotide synthase